MIKLSPRAQLAVGIALAVLMAMTRGQHFASVNLPSASWAVFFLAGVTGLLDAGACLRLPVVRRTDVCADAP